MNIRTIVVCIYIYMGGCQNYGPFLDPYYNTAPNIGYPNMESNIGFRARLYGVDPIYMGGYQNYDSFLGTQF